MIFDDTVQDARLRLRKCCFLVLYLTMLADDCVVLQWICVAVVIGYWWVSCWHQASSTEVCPQGTMVFYC